MKTVRIAIVAPFHIFGGSEHQILLLLHGLQRKGVTFVLFHLGIRSPELIEALEAIPGCKHIVIRSQSVKNLFRFFLDARHLAKQLRHNECEVVHCWNYSGHIIGGVAAKLARVPCVFSVGGLDPWKKAWQMPFYRLLNRLAVSLVFQSATECTIISQREGIPSARTEIIPNGVDHRRFDISARNSVKAQVREELGLDPAIPLILSVGSLRPIKGHDVLIEAVRRIDESQPDIPFHVLIVGDGPLRETYEQAASELPISFAGFRNDVEQLYLAADLYCQPSRSEGLPNAVIEAMCCGLPIVASEVGGMIEIVTAENGLLCKPGDPESLAGQLHKMLENKVDWPSMAAASFRLSERFSDKIMVDSYISLYSGVIRHAVNA